MYRALRMRSRLPLLAPFEKQHTYCTYCPKLCRFSCPVSVAHASETTTPWAKMTSAHHVDRGNLTMSETVAASWYGCTGCLRCRSHCTHQHEVAATLHTARAEAVRHQVAPNEASAVISQHAQRSHAAQVAGDALFDDAETRTQAKVSYFPGCTANVVRPEDALAGYEATAALTDRPVRAVPGPCCGLPLLDAGDPDGFVAAASTLLSTWSEAELVVFLDPGCLHALRVEAPRHGVRLPATPLRHVSELAASHIDRVQPLPKPARMRYHDPCRLGRGLGIYEAPRRVLHKALGHPVEEFDRHRSDAVCTGAGGQLPRTDPDAAIAVGRARLAQHEWMGGGAIVTACPGSAHQLSRSGDVPVHSFASILAQSCGDTK
ncbi:MAG: (Fe-S)-binding protein [Myxococcota bacterium]